MTVPSEDTLCRFIDPACWFPDENRPTASAFRASDRKLSTWHKDRVAQNGSALENLCLDYLEGFGEALLKTLDFLQAAEETKSPVFKPIAVWRPEEVKEPWSRWRDCHVNIESPAGPRGFPLDYRLLLAKKCEVSRRPQGV
jgi:hypothetical protein